MSTNQLKLWNDTQPTLLINSGKLLKKSSIRKKEADGGYRGNLADWVLDKFGWELEVVLRPDECPSKFKVIPKRWIVERSFAWLENFRRLTIDYEYHADTAEAMVQLAFCKIMLSKFIG